MLFLGDRSSPLAVGRHLAFLDQIPRDTTRLKKLDLGQALNTLANLGVIAGIVFLALELNQNNDFLELEAKATLSQIMLDSWATPGTGTARAHVEQERTIYPRNSCDSWNRK